MTGTGKSWGLAQPGVHIDFTQRGSSDSVEGKTVASLCLRPLDNDEYRGEAFELTLCKMGIRVGQLVNELVARCASLGLVGFLLDHRNLEIDAVGARK